MLPFFLLLDSNKNRLALDVISRLMTHCCWLNVHIVQPHGAVFEIRVAEGYGARWSSDGSKVSASISNCVFICTLNLRFHHGPRLCLINTVGFFFFFNELNSSCIVYLKRITLA